MTARRSRGRYEAPVDPPRLPGTPWQWRDAVLSAKGPDKTVRLLLCAAAKFVNKETMRTFASVARLEEASDLSRRGVQLALRRAERLGWLTRRYEEEGEGGAGIYLYPTYPPRTACAPCEPGAPPVAQDVRGEGAQSDVAVAHGVRPNSGKNPEGTPAASSRPLVPPASPVRETPVQAARRHARAVVTDDDDPRLEDAVARELARDLAEPGKVMNPGGLARTIAARLRVEPRDLEPVQTGPPAVSPDARAYYDRLMTLGDEAMQRREDGTATVLRRLARAIREGTASVPDEAPEEVYAREREHRRAQANESEVA